MSSIHAGAQSSVELVSAKLRADMLVRKPLRDLPPRCPLLALHAVSA
jgi:hypothetical protein